MTTPSLATHPRIVADLELRRDDVSNPNHVGRYRIVAVVLGVHIVERFDADAMGDPRWVAEDEPKVARIVIDRALGLVTVGGLS